MKSREFLDVAYDLSAGLREAEWRSAVSRAYYAAFHGARQLLRQCGFKAPRGDRAHAYLWRRLMNSGHPDVVNAGMSFNDLRTTRNWADYDLDRPLKQSLAVDRVQKTADALQLLEAAMEDTFDRMQITEAMKSYESNVLRETTWRP